MLLLAGNPHAGEYLKDLLVGQILWVNYAQLAVVAGLTAIVLGAWFGIGADRLGRIGFYTLFGFVGLLLAVILYLPDGMISLPRRFRRKARA